MLTEQPDGQLQRKHKYKKTRNKENEVSRTAITKQKNVALRNKDQKDALFCLNRLTPNDQYMSRTAPLTSKRCILYIFSTNTCTEYFKHAIYSPFFSLQNAVCFIMLTCLIPVLFTFYTQDVLK